MNESLHQKFNLWSTYELNLLHSSDMQKSIPELDPDRHRPDPNPDFGVPNRDFQISGLNRNFL